MLVGSRLCMSISIISWITAFSTVIQGMQLNERVVTCTALGTMLFGVTGATLGAGAGGLLGGVYGAMCPTTSMYGSIDNMITYGSSVSLSGLLMGAVVGSTAGGIAGFVCATKLLRY